jgi:hypothetical protein
MSRTADHWVGSELLGNSLKVKGFALALSAIVVAGMSIPTPAAAFSIGIGGIGIRIPGGFGGHGHRHYGSSRHHGHHEDEDDSGSADELTKGKPSDREAISKQQDLNPKSSSAAALDPSTGTPTALTGPSMASSPLKPTPALASDGPIAEATALNEHGPDFTPER